MLHTYPRYDTEIFNNFYRTIFNQAKQLGFIDKEANQNQFMNKNIEDMLNENFTPETLKY